MNEVCNSFLIPDNRSRCMKTQHTLVKPWFSTSLYANIYIPIKRLGLQAQCSYIHTLFLLTCTHARTQCAHAICNTPPNPTPPIFTPFSPYLQSCKGIGAHRADTDVLPDSQRNGVHCLHETSPQRPGSKELHVSYEGRGIGSTSHVIFIVGT